ncbi:hypothetical protein EBU58_02830 [bacterium]|nr:hypothetical protein [bacterium]
MKGLQRLACGKAEGTAKHAPECELSHEGIAADNAHPEPCPQQCQQHASPDLGPWLEVFSIGFPVPIRREVDCWEGATGGIEGGVEEPDANEEQSHERDRQACHLSPAGATRRESDAQEEPGEADPESALGCQPEHAPEKRRNVAEHGGVLCQADCLAVGHRATKAHRQRAEGDGTCSGQQRGVWSKSQHEHEAHQDTSDHRAGLVAILSTDAPAHAAGRCCSEHGQPPVAVEFATLIGHHVPLLPAE